MQQSLSWTDHCQLANFDHASHVAYLLALFGAAAPLGWRAAVSIGFCLWGSHPTAG